MKDIEQIREAAKKKLVGYTEKEIDSFVAGAMYMAGHLPQRRSEEWYEQQAKRKAEGIERSDEVCKFFQDATGLKAAVENIKNLKSEKEIIEHAFAILFENMAANPTFRKQMLDLMDAEEKSVSREIIDAVKTGIAAFNERHEDIILDFRKMEENDGRWTMSWEETI